MEAEVVWGEDIHGLLLLSHFSPCPTLCDPIDGSPLGSPIPGILQARTLGWVAISFSNAWKWKVKGKSLSCVRLLATPWTAAYQAPPPMGFSRQEYWSGLPFPSLKSPLTQPVFQCEGSLHKDSNIWHNVLILPQCEVLLFTLCQWSAFSEVRV